MPREALSESHLSPKIPSDVTATSAAAYPQKIPKLENHANEARNSKSRKSKPCGSLRFSEGDGTRTRNHRIDRTNRGSSATFCLVTVSVRKSHSHNIFPPANVCRVCPSLPCRV